MCLKNRKHIGERRQGRAVSSQLKRSSLIDSPLEEIAASILLLNCQN